MGQRLDHESSNDRETVWLSALVATFEQIDQAAPASSDSHKVSDVAARADVLTQLRRPAFSFAPLQDLAACEAHV